MKKLLILVSILAFAACSSKEKEEDMSNNEEAVVEQSADSTPAPEPAPEEASSSDDNSSSDMANEPDMNAGFPDVEGTERSGATCKNGGNERAVSVIDTREGPCGVVYTKNSNKKTVAYAKHDMTFCDKVFDNIVGNLTAGGYDCGGAGNTAKAESSDDAGTTEKDNAAEETEETGE